MERFCWANAQYSRRECLKVAGISVPASDLEKVGMEVSAKDIDACHQFGKQGRLDVKLFNRKYCQQVFSGKKDFKKITAWDLDLPNTTIKLYLYESLCPYYNFLRPQSNALFVMGKILS